MLPEHDKAVRRILDVNNDPETGTKMAVPKDAKTFIEYAESLIVKAGVNARFTKGELAMGLSLFKAFQSLRKDLGDIEDEPVKKEPVGNKK